MSNEMIAVRLTSEQKERLEQLASHMGLELVELGCVDMLAKTLGIHGKF